MTGFSRQPLGAAERFAAPASTVEPWRRRPQRVTATITWKARQALQERADQEGRSLSNLISYLLEQSLSERD